MIRVERLRLSYGEQVAVHDLDLLVPQGETLVLLGNSGCGKTSTMRCIAGLERPTQGRIAIGDRVVFDGAAGVVVPPHKRNIGMVFQSYAIWPHRTVFENVAFSLEMKQLPRDKIRGKVMDMLALVGLEAMAERGASLLSGGQMQRVALARSLVMEPAVLLLDEPLSNLDARLRERLRIELRDIQQRSGLTWIYVTHDQVEAFALADRVAVMEGGRIVQIGAPEAVYDNPATASIAEFLGIANVFACKIGDGGRSARLDGHGLVIETATLPGAGAEPHACIRSEDLYFADGPGVANSWPGRVAVISFQGSAVRYRVLVEGGPAFDVVRPRRGEPARRVGEAVLLAVRPEAVAVLPATAP